MKIIFNKKGIYFALSFSFVLLVLSIFFKVFLNINYDISSWKTISPLFNGNMKIAVIALLVINIFLIFISALGTNIILNLIHFKLYGDLKHNNRKVKIYLLYFVGYTLLNLISVVYTIINKSPLDLLYVNILSLIFFAIVSMFIYYFERNNYKQKHSKKIGLITSTLIFFCNGLITMFSVLNEIL